MIIVVMGVAGSGKTTVGEPLASELGWEFIEGDRLHPQANIEKMRAGEALTEADRAAWLERIETLVGGKSGKMESAVIAASALRRAYRNQIRSAGDEVHFIYLKGDFGLIKARLEKRPEHFFSPDLLISQFEALEEPESAIVFDVSLEPEEIVRGIRRKLSV